jgi:hypothetical protein
MKFRQHDVAVAQAEEVAIMEAADAKFTHVSDEWNAECQLLRLQRIAEHGLMDCYEGYDDGDFQGDFGSGWYSCEGCDALRQIVMVMEDPRLPGIAKTIRDRDGFDVHGELAETYLVVARDI